MLRATLTNHKLANSWIIIFFSASSTTDNLKQWLVIFEGKPNSFYENGTFFALLTFDDDYPFTPPIVNVYV